MLEKEFKTYIRKFYTELNFDPIFSLLKLFGIDLPEDFDASFYMFQSNDTTFKFYNIQNGKYYFGKIFKDHIEFVNYQGNYYITKKYARNITEPYIPYNTTCTYCLEDASLLLLKEEIEPGRKTLTLAKMVQNENKDYNLIFEKKHCQFDQTNTCEINSSLSKNINFYNFTIQSKILQSIYYVERDGRYDNDDIIDTIYNPEAATNLKINNSSKVVVESLSLGLPNIIMNANYTHNNDNIKFLLKIIKKDNHVIIIFTGTINDKKFEHTKKIQALPNINITCNDIDSLITYLSENTKEEFLPVITPKLEKFKKLTFVSHINDTMIFDFLDPIFKDYKSFNHVAYNIYCDLENLNTTINKKSEESIQESKKRLRGDK